MYRSGGIDRGHRWAAGPHARMRRHAPTRLLVLWPPDLHDVAPGFAVRGGAALPPLRVVPEPGAARARPPLHDPAAEPAARSRTARCRRAPRRRATAAAPPAGRWDVRGWQLGGLAGLTAARGC